MATQNRWAIGEMYYGGLVGGQVFFTQPGGPGTQVFPTQENGQPWLSWPAAGVIPFNEQAAAWWIPGCLHSIKSIKVIREWDYTTNMSVALLCCEVCSYVQRTMEPFESWFQNSPSNANVIIIL